MAVRMNALLLKLLVIAIILCSGVSNAEPVTIRVSCFSQEPYLFSDGQHGLTIDLLNAMNKLQDKYHFVVTDTPVRRVFQSINNQRVDIVIWDNIKWGWQHINRMQSSLSLLSEKDRFISLNRPEITQDYFASLADKKLALINGYHYQFLGFETDPDKLAQSYDVRLVKNEVAAIKMVVAGRVEIAVVSDGALAWYFNNQPEAEAQLLISDTFDSAYSRHFLVPPDAQISVSDIDNLLKQLSVNGKLTAMYAKYGFTAPNYH